MAYPVILSVRVSMASRWRAPIMRSISKSPKRSFRSMHGGLSSMLLHRLHLAFEGLAKGLRRYFRWCPVWQKRSPPLVLSLWRKVYRVVLPTIGIPFFRKRPTICSGDHCFSRIIRSTSSCISVDNVATPYVQRRTYQLGDKNIFHEEADSDGPLRRRYFWQLQWSWRWKNRTYPASEKPINCVSLLSAQMVVFFHINAI